MQTKKRTTWRSPPRDPHPDQIAQDRRSLTETLAARRSLRTAWESRLLARAEVTVANVLAIADVKFAAACPKDVELGLIGWASFSVDGNLRLDGIAVRRTLFGRYALSFPARRDTAHRRRFYVRPLDDQARCEIERQVLGALGFRDEVCR